MEINIIDQKLITNPLDIMEYGIIDFNRLNGTWHKPSEALKTIFSWFDNKATMTVIEFPEFQNAPIRDDWPQWDHSGFHPVTGRKFWNWFFWRWPKGSLVFSDSPDFYGSFPEGYRFWGDIGQVSASAFALTQKCLGIGDLWISILDDGSRHVVIESHIDIPEVYGQMIFPDEPIRPKQYIKQFEYKTAYQLPLL